MRGKGPHRGITLAIDSVVQIACKEHLHGPVLSSARGQGTERGTIREKTVFVKAARLKDGTSKKAEKMLK
jgi:hypothetical protein